jgi:hypothetical protein
VSFACSERHAFNPPKLLKVIDFLGSPDLALKASTNEAQTLPLTSIDCQIMRVLERGGSAS